MEVDTAPPLADANSAAPVDTATLATKKRTRAQATADDDVDVVVADDEHAAVTVEITATVDPKGGVKDSTESTTAAATATGTAPTAATTATGTLEPGFSSPTKQQQQQQQQMMQQHQQMMQHGYGMQMNMPPGFMMGPGGGG